MKKLAILSVVFAAFFTINANDAAAQNSLGVNVGYNLENEEFFAGGQFRFTTPALPVTINPSIETYFIDNVTWLQIDVNALYHIGREYTTAFTPYVGAGLGIDAVEGNTDAGLNLVAGADLGMSRIRPFAEARININDGTNVGVRGGVLFSL